MVDINEKGTFLVTQAVTRVLFEKKEGTIINLSSCAGLMGSKGHSCYSATKAAIHAFTLSWAKELGPFGIRVVGIAPPWGKKYSSRTNIAGIPVTQCCQGIG